MMFNNGASLPPQNFGANPQFSNEQFMNPHQSVFFSSVQGETRSKLPLPQIQNMMMADSLFPITDFTTSFMQSSSSGETGQSKQVFSQGAFVPQMAHLGSSAFLNATQNSNSSSSHSYLSNGSYGTQSSIADPNGIVVRFAPPKQVMPR
jgi:hypothetical protein